MHRIYLDHYGSIVTLSFALVIISLGMSIPGHNWVTHPGNFIPWTATVLILGIMVLVDGFCGGN